MSVTGADTAGWANSRTARRTSSAPTFGRVSRPGSTVTAFRSPRSKAARSASTEASWSRVNPVRGVTCRTLPSPNVTAPSRGVRSCVFASFPTAERALSSSTWTTGSTAPPERNRPPIAPTGSRPLRAARSTVRSASKASPACRVSTVSSRPAARTVIFCRPAAGKGVLQLPHRLGAAQASDVHPADGRAVLDLPACDEQPGEIQAAGADGQRTARQDGGRERGYTRDRGLTGAT
ncbi:hypothetical protein SGLAM104S_06241 [Streptomyces glaucescens]